MPRDVVRYLLTIVVPLRLLLTLPTSGATVPEDRPVSQADHAHAGSLSHSHHPRPPLNPELSRAPASTIAFEASEFSEEEKDDSNLFTFDAGSWLDARASLTCRPECRSPRGVRQPSRTFPLRC